MTLITLKMLYMRNIYLFLFYSFSIALSGQINYKTIQGKVVEATLDSEGVYFFENRQTAGFNVRKFDGEDVKIPTIFAAGLWIGAKREGELMGIAHSDYKNDDYVNGPFNYSGSFDFNKVWKVKGQDILDHQTDFLDGQIDDVPAQSILEWPGRKNNALGDEFPDKDFAPYFDQSADGIYDPYDGDFPIIDESYPEIIPYEMGFTIYHTSVTQEGSEPIEMEIHATMYSLACSDLSILDRAIFTKHRIINKTSKYNELYVGTWTDFDLGCSVDDFIGCDPLRNTFYSYNQDDMDGGGSCELDNFPTFNNNPAVHGSKYLNNEMSSFVVLNRSGVGEVPPGTTDPDESYEFANLLKGKWKDGTNFTYWGTGYNPGSTDSTNHLFPSDPLNSDEWSMNTVNLGPADHRCMATSAMGALENEESKYFHMVQLVTMDDQFNNFEKVALNLSEMDQIQEVFDNDFEGICSFQTGLINSGFKDGQIEIFPNPTSNNFTMIQTEDVQTYKIFDVRGKVVQEGKIQGRESNIQTNLSNGLYFIQCSSKANVFASKKILIVENF